MVTLVFVINSLGGGGAEKQVLLIAKGLALNGYHCVVFPLRKSPPHPRVGEFVSQAMVAGVVIAEPKSTRVSVVERFVSLRRIFARDQRALMWTWGYRADLFHFLLVLSGIRPASLSSLRSADADRLRRNRWFWKLVEKTSVGLVSNSWQNLQQLAVEVPVARAKGHVIYNAVDAKILCHPPVTLLARPSGLRIVMLGNVLIKTKGYDLAVQLAARIRDAGLPFTIHIGGNPFEGADLQLAIQRHGVADIISLEGLIGDPVEFLKTGHVFLMLSRFEGMSNALIEAMALGLPSISTRVGDVTRFAREHAAPKPVDLEDVRGAFDALVELWDDWPKAVALGGAGRKMCQKLFAEDRMVADTLQVLGKVGRTIEARGGQ